MAAKKTKPTSQKKKSSKKSSAKSKSGVISGMRTGFKRAVGSPGSRKKKTGQKRPIKLIDVIIWVLLLILVIWLLATRL